MQVSGIKGAISTHTHIYIYIVVDGGWGEWSTYGDCTQSCGGGVRTRSRSCDSPGRSGSGLDCFGSGLDFVNCNQQSCG